jgi:hypothetical protein
LWIMLQTTWVCSYFYYIFMYMNMCPRVLEQGYMIGLFLAFWLSSILIYIEVALTCIPTNSVRKGTNSSFSLHPYQHILLLVLTRVTWNFYIILICISFMVKMLSTPSCIYWPFVLFLRTVQLICTFINWIICSLAIDFVSPLIF